MSIKIAIIGAGGIAERAYFPILVQKPDVEIVSLYSRTQATLDRITSQWKIDYTTTDMHAVLDSRPQAAFVLSSNHSHFDICKLMLENNIDLYVEKPLATSAAQAETLAALADEHKCVMEVAFNRRYALLYKKAKEIFEGHTIQTALVQKHRPESPHVNLFNQYLDDTIHQIDLMRYYGGELEALSTHYSTLNNHLIGAVSIARTPEGGLVTLVNNLQAGAWQESVTLHGDGMTVHVDAFRELRIRYGDHEEVYGTDRAGKWIPGLRERGFEGEILHFLDCVQTRQRPMTDAWEAVKTQKFMEDLVVASGDPLSSPDNSWDKVDRWGDS
ncbi:Gfo/Idh/MocA family protein [Pelolinea submarina]|uniref:Virulence factor n=1 Tax=Pelolinea submarina TaxID=913107 RepID=A0A347ZWG4_9CHLR|nr:Gfo/Idh/MocA family oxidoreductase [Pelolinea submarina]REG05388.1 virulence factor [Pelolinea submarina]BBB49645.1 virulence factor [Pelolinea submarina]